MLRTSGWVLSALLVALAVTIVTAGAKEKRLPGGGDNPTPAPLVAEKPADAKTAQLIADLGADEYRIREKAGVALTALGEKALPAMRAALLSTDNPEVQRRLAVLVRKMDVERLIAPKRVTFSVKNKGAREIFDEIAKQTGYKIDFQGDGGAQTKHTFEFENTPFWQAVDKVANAVGCVVYADGGGDGDDTVRIFNQNQVNPYVAYAGPFRFVATSIQSNTNIQLSGIPRQGGAPNRTQNMSMSFQIQSEPKNPMLGVTMAEVVTATDDTGGSLVQPRDPNNRSNYFENRGFRGHSTYGNLNLNRAGDKSATSIKTLKAKIGIMLLSGTTPEISVADPLKVKAKPFVGRTLEIEIASLVEDANNKGQYLLDVTMKRVGAVDPDREDYNWSNNIWNKIELIDANGNRYKSFGPNNFNNNGAAIQMTVPFGADDRRGNGKPAKLGPPVRLLVNEWLSVTHEVTFEFKDLPLP